MLGLSQGGSAKQDACMSRGLVSKQLGVEFELANEPIELRGRVRHDREMIDRLSHHGDELVGDVSAVLSFGSQLINESQMLVNQTSVHVTHIFSPYA